MAFQTGDYWTNFIEMRKHRSNLGRAESLIWLEMEVPPPNKQTNNQTNKWLVNKGKERCFFLG